MTRHTFSLAASAALALLAAGPAAAQFDASALIALDEPVPLSRPAPAPTVEPVIMLGERPDSAARTLAPVSRVFADIPAGAELDRMQRAAIDAEIAARFGRRTAPPRPRAQIVDGFVFEPDVTMLLKPTDTSGLFRSTETRLRHR